MAFTTALMVFFALIVPFAGTALANHATGLQLDPESDSVPAGTCNAFTVTLTEQTTTNDTNPGAEGETIDVEVADQDPNNTTTGTNEAESDVLFCTPSSTTTAQQSGPNPQPANTAASDDPNGTDGTISAEICCTDENGQITFGIVSDEPGNFLVTAFFEEPTTANPENDDPDQNEFQDSSQKEFTAGAAQGGVEALDCEPESDSNPQGSTHTFTCTATNAQGQNVANAEVSFDVTAGPNAEEQGPQRCLGGTGTGDETTNQQGQVTCSYTDQTGTNSPPGTDTIVAFVQETPPTGQQGGPGPDAFEAQDTITKTFVGAANDIECQPDNGTATSGDIVEITCTVTDEAGQPVPGVQVNFTESGAGTFRQPGTTQTDITDENGQATVEIQTGTNEEGTITVTGTIVDRADDPNTTANEANETNCQGSTGTAETGTNADCSDTATVTVTQEEEPPPPPPAADCNDGIDNDGDGLTDFPNDPGCTSADDQTEAPNPQDDEPTRVATNLTIRYDRNDNAFKGSVGSSRKACQTGRTVLLKKVTPGRNRTVGRDTSNRNGNWRINKARARGRYYAIVLRQVAAGRTGRQFNCLRDRSVTIKVGRRR